MSNARSDEFIEDLEGRLLLSASSLRHASKARHSHTAAIVQSVSHAKKTVATPKVTTAAATTTTTTDPAGGPDGENVDGGPNDGGAETTTEVSTPETGGTSETGDTTGTATAAKITKSTVKASKHSRRR